MISIGINLGGPERLPIEDLLRAAIKAAKAARDDGDDFLGKPSINVVFYVPGSLNVYKDLNKIEAARFSRKQKSLLVAIPVPLELVQSRTAIDFVVDALFQASRLAADIFTRKGCDPFDLERAEAIVEKVRQSLVNQVL
jgi:hypothetical protein